VSWEMDRPVLKLAEGLVGLSDGWAESWRQARYTAPKQEGSGGDDDIEFAVANTLLKRAGIDLISLLTPTSDDRRIDLAAGQGSGFLYYVSVTGVTGARLEVSGSVAGAVARIRERTDLPVAVGFGISTPRQAGQMAAVADGVVVGSALVSLFEQYQGSELSEKVAQLVRSLKDAVRNVGENRHED